MNATKYLGFSAGGLPLAVLFILTCMQCSDGSGVTSGDLRTSETEYLSSEDKPTHRFSDFFIAGQRIALEANNDFRLGPMPSLGAINRRGEFIVLDNYGVRQILVFDRVGKPVGKIGTQGNEKGQYLFPDDVFYQQESNHFFVFDGDLLRLLEFDENSKYVSELSLPIYLEQFLFTYDKRLICYSSGAAGPEGADYVIHEYDRTGRLRNRFLRMPSIFTAAAESKGGGIVLIKDFLYVIIPYDYTIYKFNISGKLNNKVHVQSPHYTAMKPYTDRRIESEFEERKRYHSTWSHILQIVQLGEDRFGIVYNEAGTRQDYLDIYNLDPKRLVDSILLPNHVPGPHALYTVGEKLYMIEPSTSSETPHSADLFVIEYLYNRKNPTG